MNGRPAMRFRQRTINDLAGMICGNDISEPSFFRYRTKNGLGEFFTDASAFFEPDPWENSRFKWTVNALEMINEPSPSPDVPPDAIARVICLLMEQEDAINEPDDRPGALSLLNKSLKREWFEAFYASDKRCYLRHVATGAAPALIANPHRPFSAEELATREALAAYLDIASEDELIEEVLLPLFRQLGFQRITAPGHKDKALEYGKDVWMRFTLPTLHVLYFGIQAKKGRIDAAGQSRKGSANIAEIHNQALMMVGHEIFDHETSRRVLVDHAFIISGGEITKAARNWLGNKLDPSKRSQIMFIDRDDILNLYVAAGIPVPEHATGPAQPERRLGQVSGRGWRGALPDAGAGAQHVP